MSWYRCRGRARPIMTPIAEMSAKRHGYLRAVLGSLILGAAIIFNFEVFAQNTVNKPIRDYLGVWIDTNWSDKAQGCRQITQGGDIDAMLIISEHSFRQYLPQSPCTITKTQRLSDTSASIEARCDGRVIKETWSMNKETLQRRTAQNYLMTYVRCKKAR